MSQDEFKIRVLPRTTEPRRADGVRTSTGKRPVRRWTVPKFNRNSFIFFGLIFALSLLVGIVWRAPRPKSHDMSSQKIVRDPTAARISRLVEDVKAKEDFQRQQRELGNMISRDTKGEVDVSNTSPEAARSYGVSLDSENTADRLYEQLNDRTVQSTDNTPDTRINAMLEKNKWLNQQERQERVQYVRNFIKTAYDRGYEVDLDQDLQVVGVRPILNRRISLDQAIEKATHQGF